MLPIINWNELEDPEAFLREVLDRMADDKNIQPDQLQWVHSMKKKLDH